VGQEGGVHDGGLAGVGTNRDLGVRVCTSSELKGEFDFEAW